ncbi:MULTISPECIES: hypothetical protein [Gammaproteobacteria]|uniref:hypothetical protein n=1 Tax=Gammaproteobacteria TaxID=1236 RepID=UPI000DD0E52F|nr:MULTISPECIES: hypothetical protein [Gammaproteobacteria]RTE86460.1 hypothetical protein DQX04_07845 [Aliidiomarina sp. B3213]TCZ90985.1 hypothetical protein EYQ95_09200 [Lysobacter sp. N42]
MTQNSRTNIWLIFLLIGDNYIVLNFINAPRFLFEPDEELWFVVAKRELSFADKIRAELLLNYGADSSFEIARETAFEISLRERGYEMLTLMSDYVSDVEKQHALRFAKSEGDAELLIFLRLNYDY